MFTIPLKVLHTWLDRPNTGRSRYPDAEWQVQEDNLSCLSSFPHVMRQLFWVKLKSLCLVLTHAGLSAQGATEPHRGTKFAGKGGTLEENTLWTFTELPLDARIGVFFFLYAVCHTSLSEAVTCVLMLFFNCKAVMLTHQTVTHGSCISVSMSIWHFISSRSCLVFSMCTHTHTIPMGLVCADIVFVVHGQSSLDRAAGFQEWN